MTAFILRLRRHRLFIALIAIVVVVATLAPPAVADDDDGDRRRRQRRDHRTERTYDEPSHENRWGRRGWHSGWSWGGAPVAEPADADTTTTTAPSSTTTTVAPSTTTSNTVAPTTTAAPSTTTTVPAVAEVAEPVKAALEVAGAALQQAQERITETVGTTPFSVARQIGLVGLDGTQIPYTGRGVQVALIDTGVADVPGLRASNVTLGPDFSFEDQFDQLRGRDTNGHGTHMAGIIVGADQAWSAGDTVRSPDRMIGVAPDAELVSIKVSTANGAVDVSQVIAAINWVVDHRNDPGMDIRVLALAYNTDSQQTYLTSPLAYAVERAWHAGIVVVVAAGNRGSDDWALRAPADDPYVIAVGAADDSETIAPASFTSDGNMFRSFDVLAPGCSIISLRVPGAYSDQFNEQGRIGDRYVRGSGSSQAAAIVAGAAALLIEQRPELTPDQVKTILMKSLSMADSKNWYNRDGLINVAAALEMPTPDTVQRHWPAAGTGSLDADRGSARVELDGQPIKGNIDIFGNDYSDSKWTDDAWSGNSWSGDSWTGNSWTGNSWTGNSWSGNSWTGNSWTGNSWSGNSWTGNSWSGNSWTGNSWTGHDWD